MKLAKTMVAVALMTGAGPLFAEGSVRLAEVPLPKNVAQAVKDNYAWGRGEMDFGGIAKVRVFRLAGATRDRLAVVSALIAATKADSEGSLAKACGVDQEHEEPIADQGACAKWIIEHGAGPRFLGFASWIGGDSGEEADAKKFARDVAAVRAFVALKAGKGFTEYSTTANVWSVDVSTSLLLDAAGKTAIVVTYDYGA